MKFAEWKNWLNELPWILRWFPLLVLIRPILDSFYNLKEVSPFLSPLYIVGILTPIFCAAALLRFRKVKLDTTIDRLFKLWSWIAIISAFSVCIYDGFSLEFFRFFLKLTIPVFLYFFCRVFIESERDLIGILQTFIYSSIFVIGTFLFEILINPIRLEQSRGLERIQGLFGDVLNYSFYLTFCLVITGYFSLKSSKKKSFVYKNKLVIFALIMGALVLPKINHAASYIIFGFILIILLFFNSKTNKISTIGAVLFGIVAAALFGTEFISDSFERVISVDMQVYAGEKSAERLFHGRIGRWKWMIEEFTSLPIYAQLFGMPLNFQYAYHFIGSGSHNDFIRIMCFSGYVGIILYMSFLNSIYARIKYYSLACQFLIMATLFTLCLYSVTVNPTFYAPILYITLSVFAFCSIKIQNNDKA